MFKKISFACGILVIAALSSCKEKSSAINLDAGHTAKDSTYTSTVEVAQAHVILVEEFTGASCANCPAARKTLSTLEAANPGRILVLGLHLNGFPQSNPVAGSSHDFRTTEATDISNYIYGSVGAMPSAGFERRKGISSSVNPPLDNLAYSNLWPDLISQYLDSTTPVNLSVTSQLNANGDTAFISVKAAYTRNVNTKNTLTVAITESGLVDKQDSSNVVIAAYTFNDVLRGFVTPTLGSAVLDSLPIKVAGRVFTRSFLYKVNATWKPENCKVIAFIANGETDDKHVLQAAEVNLK